MTSCREISGPKEREALVSVILRSRASCNDRVQRDSSRVAHVKQTLWVVGHSRRVPCGDGHERRTRIDGRCVDVTHLVIRSSLLIAHRAPRACMALRCAGQSAVCVRLIRSHQRASGVPPSRSSRRASGRPLPTKLSKFAVATASTRSWLSAS